jgi:hypothetical protein
VLVISAATGDPYGAVIHANETDIQLVMINGVARYGVGALMSTLSPGGEAVRVGGQPRQLFLKQETSDPDVAAVSLKSATSTLGDALRDIAQLAKKTEPPKPKIAARILDAVRAPVWSLALDEIQNTGEELRPRLPFNGPRDFTGPRTKGTASLTSPLSKILKPIELDPLTVADDDNFLDEIEQQPNLPAAVKSGLRDLY